MKEQVLFLRGGREVHRLDSWNLKASGNQGATLQQEQILGTGGKNRYQPSEPTWKLNDSGRPLWGLHYWTSEQGQSFWTLNAPLMQQQAPQVPGRETGR